VSHSSNAMFAINVCLLGIFLYGIYTNVGFKWLYGFLLG
jgi:hypothetical protein